MALRTSCLLLVLAGCGGSSPDVSAPPPEQKSPAPAAKAPPDDAPSKAIAEPVATAPPDAADDTEPTAVAWTIEASPSTLKASARGDLEIRITVTNNGTEVVRPPWPLGFQVDGERSSTLEMAFGNGGRGKEWIALEPGKTASNRRVGVDFTNAVGEHAIAIMHEGTELARTTVTFTR